MIDAIAFLIFWGGVIGLVLYIVKMIAKCMNMATYGYTDSEDWDHRDEMFTQNEDDFEDF